MATESEHSKGDIAYVIQEIEGKGMGMVARRDIAQGELIISEQPLIKLNDADADDMEAVLERKLSEMPEADRKRFWDLTDCKAADESHKTAIGVFKTNGLPLAESAGLFPTIARCNHSCAPNAYHTWRFKEDVEQIRAQRHIKQGEEICITYYQIQEDFLIRSQRQKKLKDTFGFDCSCEHCSLTGNALKANDDMREKFFKDENMFRTIVRASYMAAQERFRNIEKCGAPFGQGEKARIAHDAFILAQFLGLTQDAKKWCLLSYEFRAISEGSDSVDAQRMLYCLKNFL